MSAVFSVDAQKRMCEGKRTHLSEIRARIAATGCMARAPGLQLRPYQCPNCSFWHLTSKPLQGASRPRVSNMRRPRMTRSTTRSK